MPTNETEAVTALSPVEYLNQLQAIVNQFVAAANAAQATFAADLQALESSAEFQALNAAQPHLVKAIADAEMNRMAEALPQ